MIHAHQTAPTHPPEHLWLAVLFSPSEAGQAAGREFLKRKHLRQEGRDPEVNDKVSPAQIEAMRSTNIPNSSSAMSRCSWRNRVAVRER